MPFMRSESCSFIWQPKVVTWNDFIAGLRVVNCGIEGGVGRGAKVRLGRLMVRMGPQTTPDHRLAALAARQYRVVSREQLRAMGLGERAIARRVASGRLHRLHRGVYAVGHT